MVISYDGAAVLAAGDVKGAVELNIRTWRGPGATAEVADHVRRMQRHAFGVQLAAEDNALLLELLGREGRGDA